MSRLRLLLAWLVMVALPLQGIAAVSMLYCNGAHHVKASAHHAQKAQPSQHHGSAGDHDHSQHAHAEPAQIEKTDDASSALPDPAHKCGVCASCCHSLGMAGFVSWPPFAPLPQASPSEPFALLHAAHSQLPDKPPRA